MTFPVSFDRLREKWLEVPAGPVRARAQDLLALSDEALLAFWKKARAEATTGSFYRVRGWYHALYKDVFRGKKVLDVGCGLGMDGLTFAEHGAAMTLADIIRPNCDLVGRLARLLGLPHVATFYIEDIKSLSRLEPAYEVVWCQGALINAPFDFVREEAQALLQHLPIGGRWIELAYPKQRWDREGRPEFNRWGAQTDGGAPWMEWYDQDKLMARLAPAEFEVVLHFNFHDDDFNWFDLIRTA